MILRGRLPDGDVRFELSQSDAPATASNGIALRWARSRIEALLDSLQAGAAADEVRASVIRISSAFGIATPYTSLVAVEEVPDAAGEAETVRLANSLPAGASLEGMLPQGGTPAPLLLRVALLLMVIGGGVLAVLRRAW